MTVLTFFRSIQLTSTRVWHTRRAATAVEFALIAPVFFMMTLGVIEMGRAMFIKAAIQFSVEETARYAAVNQSATEAELETKAALSYTDSGAGISGATFTVIEEDADGRTYMSITGSYEFSVFVPLISIPDITLQAKSRMPID